MDGGTKEMLTELVRLLRKTGQAAAPGPAAGQASIVATLMAYSKQKNLPTPVLWDEDPGAIPVKVSFGRWVRLSSVLLQTTETTIYTANQNIPEVWVNLANVDSSARTAQLYHYASGGSASDTTSVWKSGPLAVGEAVAWPDGVRSAGLSASDVISGLCSSNSTVTATLYGRF